MSRRIGAYVVYTPSGFPEEVQGLITRVEDLSPVTESLAYAAVDEARRRLASGGDGEWPPRASSTVDRNRFRSSGHTIGVGEHGGFSQTLRPFFGKRNFGWKTRAAHAHLFSLGRQNYSSGGDRVARWGSRKGGRTSRPRAEGRDGTRWDGHIVQEPRPFDYMSEQLQELAQDKIASYVLLSVR